MELTQKICKVGNCLLKHYKSGTLTTSRRQPTTSVVTIEVVTFALFDTVLA
jgi:hypothetical protein